MTIDTETERMLVRSGYYDDAINARETIIQLCDALDESRAEIEKLKNPVSVPDPELDFDRKHYAGTEGWKKCDEPDCPCKNKKAGFVYR